MLFEIAARFFQRPGHARPQIIWVQTVQQQQAANQFIAPAFLHHGRSSFARLRSELENSFDSRPMQGHERLEKLPGHGACTRVAGRFELLDNLPDALYLLLQPCVLRHSLLQTETEAGGCASRAILASPGLPLARITAASTTGRSKPSSVLPKHRRMVRLQHLA